MKIFTVSENDYDENARRVDFPTLLKETAERATDAGAERYDRVNVSFADGLVSIENNSDGTAEADGRCLDAKKLLAFLENLPGVELLEFMRWKNPDLPPTFHARAYEA